MWDDGTLREVLSGQRTGIFPSLCRGALTLSAAWYGAAVYLRNRSFDWRIRRVHRMSVPVISVGNLTVGGTGKSPFVIWLAERLKAQGRKPAVVSRGYGAVAGQPNDEALEMRLRVPGLTHLQGVDRVASARRAISEFGAQILLLDDGFQHRRLARDWDIVLIDSLEPFGFGHLLPRGFLREPVSALRRADTVVLTRSDCVASDTRNQIRNVVRRYAPGADWIEAAVQPTGLVDAQGNEFPLNELRDARLFGFAAIGNPAAFRRTLESISHRLVGFRTFPDHHRFDAADWESLVDAARQAKADLLACTCKDLVKIPGGADPYRLRAVTIEWRVTEGLDLLEERLRKIAIVAQDSPATPD